MLKVEARAGGFRFEAPRNRRIHCESITEQLFRFDGGHFAGLHAPVTHVELELVPDGLHVAGGPPSGVQLGVGQRPSDLSRRMINEFGHVNHTGLGHDCSSSSTRLRSVNRCFQ